MQAHKIMVVGALIGFIAASACDPPSTDDKQGAEQAQALAQAHAMIGMPAIGNFSEKRMVKDLYELRDKPVSTHTYIVNEQTGCLMYLGPSVGYGIPYSTQYTAPTRVTYTHPSFNDGNETTSTGYVEQVPQAEPNGLFMPSAAEGTWVMLKDPNGPDVKAVYIEPRIVVSPFRITSGECAEKPVAQMHADAGTK